MSEDSDSRFRDRFGVDWSGARCSCRYWFYRFRQYHWGYRSEVPEEVKAVDMTNNAWTRLVGIGFRLLLFVAAVFLTLGFLYLRYR